MPEILFRTYVTVLILGAIISLFKLLRLAPVYLRVLLPVFILTITVECFARYYLDRPNHWLYNLFLPVQYLLFTILFFLVFKSKKVRAIIISCSILLLSFSISNILFIQGFQIFNTYTLLVSGFLILCWVFLYFRNLLQSKEQIYLLREPMFWISSGLLIFYLGNVFVAGTIDYFIKNDLDTAKVLLQIIKLLNIIMFTLFIVALLCQKRQVKS